MKPRRDTLCRRGRSRPCSVVMLCLLLSGCMGGALPQRGLDGQGTTVLALVQNHSGITPWRRDDLSVTPGDVDVIPLVSYDFAQACWVPGGWYDGTIEVPASAGPRQPLSVYWASVANMALRCPWHPAIEVSDLAMVSYEDTGVPDELMAPHVRGRLSASWTGECALLVTNAANGSRQPRCLELQADDVLHSAVLRVGTKGIRKAAAKFARDPLGEQLGFGPCTEQPVLVSSAVCFKLTDRRDGLWVALTQEFTSANDAESSTADAALTAYYYAIVALSGGDGMSVLWEECSFDDIGNLGTFFRFLGAADINGDGRAEVALQRYFYERSIYEVYELSGKGMTCVAEAYDVGL